MGASRRLMLGALLVAMAAGCPFSFTNEDHCAAQDGDASCAGADAARPYCALDGCGLYDEVDNRTGCVAEQPADLSCYSPCGGKQDANARTDCSSPGTDTTESSSTSATDSGTTEAPMTDASSTGTQTCDCEEDMPICEEGECIPCMASETCAAAGLPGLCSEGRCVECVSTLPSAGAAAHLGCAGVGAGQPNCVEDVCRPACQFPEDCPGTGCDLRTGLCAPQDAVFYVAPDGDDGNDGSRELPLRTMEEALERLRGDAYPARFGTIALQSNATYEEDIVLVAERVVLRSWVSDPPPRDSTSAPVVVGAAGSILDPDDPRGVVTLTRSDGGPSTLIISDVDFGLADSDLPFANVGNTCLLVVEASQILNSAGVLRGENVSAAFRNSLIAGSREVPFQTDGSSELVITASTVVNNGTDAWFECSETGAYRLEIRESIVGYDDAPAEIGGLIPEACDAAGVAPRNSVIGTEVAPGDFRDAPANDFRLEVLNGDLYFKTDPDFAFCPPGAKKQVGLVAPCPPELDAEGNVRVGMPGWVGYDASSPAP